MKRALLPFLVLLGACGDNQTHPDPHAGYDAGAPVIGCVPDLDGKIDSSEMKAAIGIAVRYLVSPAGKTRTVDVAGATDGAGHLVWNWGTDYADDQAANLEASNLSGKWYASSFSGGQFVAPFDAGGAIEAVYSQDDQAIWLHGIASAQPSPKTLLVYEQPVALYRFPLQAGASWTSQGVVKNGTLNNSPWASTDTYAATDDATGRLVLPELTFTQAHRVRFTVTQQNAAGTHVTRQASFVFECFGEVGRATSGQDETKDDFTTAAEQRRFQP